MRDLAATRDFARKNSARKNFAVLAALSLSALAAAPFVLGASAPATAEEPAAIAAGLRTGPVDVAPVAAVVAAPAAEGAQAPCPRKVRVVYGGYGTPAGACAAR